MQVISAAAAAKPTNPNAYLGAVATKVEGNQMTFVAPDFGTGAVIPGNPLPSPAPTFIAADIVAAAAPGSNPTPN